jgi:hypothetical protein
VISGQTAESREGQFHLNGFRADDPMIEPVAEGAPRVDLSEAVDVLIAGCGAVVAVSVDSGVPGVFRMPNQECRSSRM